MGRRAPGAAPAGTLVARLERLARRFGPAYRIAKVRVLSELASRPIAEAGLLLRYHEALAFVRAYPDDPEVLRLAEALLAAFGARVQALTTVEADALEESGLVGTRVYPGLTYRAARWLAARFPADAELDWDDVATETVVGSLLAFCEGGLIREETLVESDVPSRDWVAAARGHPNRGGYGQSHLHWLLARLSRAIPDPVARCALYDEQPPRVRWVLRHPLASRTLARWAEAGLTPFCHPRGLLRTPRPVSRRDAPRLPVRVASRREAEALLDLARAAVAVRYRGTYSFDVADPDGALLADAGRGFCIAWFGVRPAHRLPFRALHGFLLLKNGLPVGYGDAALFFDWVEGGGGIHVFESFRGGEAGFAFGRLVAFLRQRFGVRAIHLSRWDIGYGNPEGIASGAFWFYYRLGFRPKRPDLRRLAEAERRRVGRTPRTRTSRATLGRLSQAGMLAALAGRVEPAVRDFAIHRLALRAQAVAARPGAQRLATAAARWLEAPDWRTWAPIERRALEGWAPVLTLVPDLPAWPRRERVAVRDAIRAKAGPAEAEYLRRLRALPRLRRAVLALGVP